MPVIPIHYFVFHPEGTLRGTNPPGGSGGLVQNAEAIYPYMVACRGIENPPVLPKAVSVEPASVTCPKCKATEIFQANYKPIGAVEEIL